MLINLSILLSTLFIKKFSVLTFSRKRTFWKKCRHYCKR
ncbi:hypothetical protein [Enterococcus phage vB_Efs4_KEN02]